MIAIERILLPHQTLVYLLNLAVIASLACAVGLAVAHVCRKCSAPLKHGILVSVLALTLASPLLVGLGQQTGIGLVRITVSVPGAADPRDFQGPAAAPESTSPEESWAQVEIQAPGDLRSEPSPQPPHATAQANPAVRDTPTTQVETNGFLGLSDEGLDRVDRTEATSAVGASPPSGVTSVAWWRWAGSLAAYAWAAGICFGLVRLARGLLVVGQLRRCLETPADAQLKGIASEASRLLGTRKPPRVCTSPLAPMPMALGLFRPAIVLPSTAGAEDAEQLKSVLLHEAAHLARGDHWVALAQQAAGIVFWWNPLLHWLNDQICDLREDICDNYVVRAWDDGAGFAKFLVEAAARAAPERRLPSTIGILKPKLDSLAGRVTRLVDKDRNTATNLDSGSILTVVTFALAGLIAMALVGGLRVAQARPSAVSEATGTETEKSPPEVEPADKAEAEDAAGEPQGRRMLVRIIDEAGQPVAGARLRVAAARDITEHRSDSNGEVHLPLAEKDPGYFVLRALADGYVPMAARWSNARRWDPIPSEFNLKVPKGTTIGGIVQDEAGRPIEGAEVLLRLPSDNVWGDRAALGVWDLPVPTNAEGKWRVEPDAGGASSPGNHAPSPGLPQRHEPARTDPDHRTAPRQSGVMVMQKGFTVTGTVSDPDGNPLAGACVFLGQHLSRPGRQTAKTDEQGCFRFEHVEASGLYLWAFSAGWAPRRVVVAVGAEMDPLSVELQRGRTVRVRVVDEKQQPLADAFVGAGRWLYPDVAEEIGPRRRTDRGGRWAWTWAPNEAVALSAQKEGRSAPIRPWPPDAKRRSS